MTLHGMDALQSAMRSAPERTLAYAADAVAATTFSVAQRIRANAWEDTGRLKRAISGSATGLNGRITIDDDAYYWRMQEYGWTTPSGRSIPARPVIRTSVEEETSVFEQRIRAIAPRIERDFSAGRFV